MRPALAAVAVAALGCKEPQPVPWSSSPPPSYPAKLQWSTEETAAFAQARADGKGVMLDFTAAWSVPCAELDRELEDSAIAEAINKRFVPLKVDVSNDTETTAAMRERYRAATLPTIVFVDVERRELARVDRMVDAGELLALVQRL